MNAASCAEPSTAGPVVGAQPQQPVTGQRSAHPGDGPEGQPLRDETPLLERQHTPEGKT